MSNQAFIDGQNLHLGTTSSRPAWKVDLKRFRVYLQRKYNIEEAYYFLGCVNDCYVDMYNDIQKAGFILVFREHSTNMSSIKKGNVDTDIVFNIMKKLCKREKFDKVFLISGDGDYYKMVDFLIEEKKLGKILFPVRKKASSLYKKLAPQYFDALDNPAVKEKILYKKTKK
ncbi:MAG: NYN domain-containing protein [Pseudomonadales bacterium]|jgi:uncharacterized LabA/DUF88 family protein|nr:NYN domain-containing protein [Pseudomonadales bacterium]